MVCTYHCSKDKGFLDDLYSVWLCNCPSGFSFSGKTNLVRLHHCSLGFGFPGSTCSLTKCLPNRCSFGWRLGCMLPHSITDMSMHHASVRGIGSSSPRFRQGRCRFQKSLDELLKLETSPLNDHYGCSSWRFVDAVNGRIWRSIGVRDHCWCWGLLLYHRNFLVYCFYSVSSLDSNHSGVV